MNVLFGAYDKQPSYLQIRRAVQPDQHFDWHIFYLMTFLTMFWVDWSLMVGYPKIGWVFILGILWFTFGIDYSFEVPTDPTFTNVKPNSDLDIQQRLEQYPDMKTGFKAIYMEEMAKQATQKQAKAARKHKGGEKDEHQKQE